MLSVAQISKIIRFIVAYLIVAVFAIYAFRLPLIITRNQDLVHEYYYVNPAFSLFMDFIFIALYYLFAMMIWNKLQITSVVGKGFVFIASTAFLTTFFWFYFTRYPMNTSFFSRWFHTVGLRSVVYDVILLTIIFIIYQEISSDHM
jgi:hypothetical protein